MKIQVKLFMIFIILNKIYSFAIIKDFKLINNIKSYKNIRITSAIMKSSSSSSSSSSLTTDIEDILLNFENKNEYSFNEYESKYFREELLKFYHNNRRLLPWRGDIVDGIVPPQPSAYGTWISEIMLQQTRVETVIPYWRKWMEKFPTIEKVAEASQEDINGIWAGLGYYRRARMILECAKKVVAEYNGILPQSASELLKLPGIGEYTSGAISSIAYGKKEAVVDGNVFRVLSRIRAINYELGSPDMTRTTWKLARQLVDCDEPGNFNQALMELGATVCKPTSPSCDQCPVRNVCIGKQIETVVSNISKNTLFNDEKKSNGKLSKLSKSQLDNLPSDVCYFPIKVAKAAPREIILSVAVFQQNIDNEIKYLFVKRPDDKGLLANQWEFPSIIKWEEAKKSKNEENLKEIPSFTDSELWEPFPNFLSNNLGIQWTNTNTNDDKESFYLMTPTSTIKRYEPIVHVFSHQRHTMHVGFYEVDIKNNGKMNSNTNELRETKWMTKEEITVTGVTTGCKKILDTVTSSTTTVSSSKKRKKSTNNVTNDSKKQMTLNFSVKKKVVVKEEEIIILNDEDNNDNEVKYINENDVVLIEHCKS